MDWQQDRASLDDLARHCGVHPDYYDIWGKRHEVSEQTKRAVLAAMGYHVDSEEDVRGAWQARREDAWRPGCEPVLVRRSDQPPGEWSFYLSGEESDDPHWRIVWEVLDEGGRLQHKQEAGPGLRPSEVQVINGRRCLRIALPLPDGLTAGYYDLTASAAGPQGGVSGTLRLIIVPPRCFVPAPVLEGARTWGVALQLYALRSSRNWGVGDFGDLADVVERAALDLKAGAVGLNPLHALKNSRPYHISPYSPDSRLFLNTLYIAIDRIPELAESEAARRMLEEPDFQARLRALRDSDVVDYDRVSAAKLAVLELLFQTFRSRHFDARSGAPATSRARAFVEYLDREGELLERFALFQALTEELRRSRPEAWVWQDWPAAYRDPEAAEVRAFRQGHTERIRFHQYLQWLASEQLEEVAARTRALHMPLGLYHDLAIGSDRTGADAWMFQHLLASRADSGCPPDAFSPEGQNWGFPPMDPHRLRADRYELFIQLLRRNLAHGGALRLDHVMGLFRLFWIPRGLPPSAGAYVAYPAEDLLGILALESWRHQAVIVGEDLGTVPDEVRERLAGAGVLSYRVLYFERRHDGGWKAPAEYPQQAVAVVTTHDLPTLDGFWTGHDIETRAALKLFPDEGAGRQALAERQQERLRLLAALRAEGLWPRDGDPTGSATLPGMTADFVRAVHLFLARAPSWLVLAMLDDVLGETAQMNLPGTVDAFPNWSRKYRVPVEDLWGLRDLRTLADDLGALRRPWKDGGRA